MAREKEKTAEAAKTGTVEVVKEAKLVQVSPGRPLYPLRAKEAFGISPGDWMVLVDAIFPGAKTTEAVELALAYCRARNLDPFKRPMHIVEIWDSKKGRTVESVWPGIGELRTTAARTGAYAGHDEIVFGPDRTETFKGTTKGQYGKEVEKTVTFPEWAQQTVYRMVQGQRCPFEGAKVYWLETYATLGGTDVPNEMWETRARGQLGKCAQAEALREAFPEEIGSDYIAEEVGRRGRLSAEATDLPSAVVATSKLDAFAAKHEAGGAQIIDVAAALAIADRPKSSTLTPAQIEGLRAYAKDKGVALERVEELWACPLVDVKVGEGMDAETEVRDVIDDLAEKAGKE